jgi:hypothetical protein
VAVVDLTPDAIRQIIADDLPRLEAGPFGVKATTRFDEVKR